MTLCEHQVGSLKCEICCIAKIDMLLDGMEAFYNAISSEKRNPENKIDIKETDCQEYIVTDYYSENVVAIYYGDKDLHKKSTWVGGFVMETDFNKNICSLRYENVVLWEDAFFPSFCTIL